MPTESKEMIMSTIRTALSLSLLVSLMPACSDDLTPGSLIDRERVLGARVEVIGDSQRATPAPGESIEVIFLVEGPGPVRPLAWALAPCIAGDPVGGVATCAEEPFDSIQGSGAEARISIDVPAAEQLGDAARLAVLGLICAGGSPARDQDGNPVCVGDGAVATPVALQISILRDQANHNPSLVTGALAIDGAGWPAASAQPMTGCAASAELPQVAVDEEVPVEDQIHVITIEVSDDARETYTAIEGDPPREVEYRERLQLSHFVTAGELERQYSVIDRDAVVSMAEVEWTPPAIEEVPEDGLRVRFTLVARDLRGGVAWTARELCAVR